jgi:hypothetical protein
LVEGAERLALGERQADHHPDVVAVALDALGLLAEKRGADLAGEFALGEPERLTFRADGDEQFVAVAAGIVPGVGDAFVGLEQVSISSTTSILVLARRAADLDGDGFHFIAAAAESAAAVAGDPERLDFGHSPTSSVQRLAISLFFGPGSERNPGSVTATVTNPVRGSTPGRPDQPPLEVRHRR